MWKSEDVPGLLQLFKDPIVVVVLFFFKHHLSLLLHVDSCVSERVKELVVLL